MPKPMLNRPQTQTRADSMLSTTHRVEQKQNTRLDKMQLDRLLRKPRSKEYMAAMSKLDSGGHVHNQHKVDEIINTIRNEFPDVELNGILLGIVSACYLGVPYEVHSLDITGQIIEHYKSGQSLGGGLEKARSVAMCKSYACVEVYIDCCRAIGHNGSVSVVKFD